MQGLESAKAKQRATKLADLLGQEGLSGSGKPFLKGPDSEFPRTAQPRWYYSSLLPRTTQR